MKTDQGGWSQLLPRTSRRLQRFAAFSCGSALAANERMAPYFFLNKSSGFNLGAVFVEDGLAVAGF
jgi:hypothetical protein